MAMGIVERAEVSQSGKSIKVVVDGRRYLSKSQALLNAVGKEIIFETSTSDFNGKTFTWIERFQFTDPTRTMGPTTGGLQRPATPPSMAQNVTRSPESYDQLGTRDLMPMTSNLVAHAISAGLVTQPEDLSKWARYAFHAAKHCSEPIDTPPSVSNTIPAEYGEYEDQMKEPEPNDDIPY